MIVEGAPADGEEEQSRTAAMNSGDEDEQEEEERDEPTFEELLIDYIRQQLIPQIR